LMWEQGSNSRTAVRRHYFELESDCLAIRRRPVPLAGSGLRQLSARRYSQKTKTSEQKRWGRSKESTLFNRPLNFS